MEQIRSFIAVELPVDLKRALQGLQGQMKTGSRAPVKWVDADNMHLTLKFLGNIDTGITAKITGALEEAARGIHPFTLEAKGLGVFPGLKRVNIIWVGLTGDLGLVSKLQQNIESKLAPLGFSPESKSFTPHLTLGRLRDRATPYERQDIGRLIADTSFEAGYDITVGSVHLMSSQLTREGPVYSRISSVSLE